MDKNDWIQTDRMARCTIGYGVIAALAGTAIAYACVGAYLGAHRVEDHSGAITGFLLAMFVANVVRHLRVSIGGGPANQALARADGSSSAMR